MIGAIAGDIIGSAYEGRPIKTTDFPLFRESCRFTDDSVLTAAIAKAILEGTSYFSAVKEIGRRYPNAGYGGTFIHWLFSESSEPYNSWGNGSAMRVSPVGFAFDSAERVLDEAAKTAEITHNHPEGIKGAQAIALAVFLARTGQTKSKIRESIQSKFKYDLGRTVDQIRPGYRFDVSCQGSVPESIIAFLDSTSFEDAVRKAVSLGGDSDTMACMAGSIAEAYYGGVPRDIVKTVRAFLTDDLWDITSAFCARYYDLSIKVLDD
ncbi:MAG: ADP-ribosylglycohydrolase family protein [Phycisphaerales bacterium]|nr:MAG: ADP-ribosylglycohydrolase family protein [Phycisphaerales bacterium]